MRSIKCLLLLVLLGITTLSADDGRALPAFSVTSATGATVASSALSPQPRWLLVYVSPACRSCDRLLESMKEWQSPAVPSRTVIVVRGADASRYIAEHQSSALSAVWYVDDHDDGWRTLELKSSPALIGVRQGEIKWTLSGVLNDPKALESVIRKWVE